jgi:hypothetical protein
LMKDTLKDMNEELEQRVEAVKAAEARTLLLESQLSNCTDELAAARHTMQQLEVSCFAHCRGIVCPRVSSSVLLWSGASVWADREEFIAWFWVAKYAWSIVLAVGWVEGCLCVRQQ